jgi:hypothetical protein
MKKYSYFALLYLFGGAMENRRFRFIGRHQGVEMLKVPFKDSKRAIIKENCRKTQSSRRFDDISLDYFKSTTR